jgi:hypothetical protein
MNFVQAKTVIHQDEMVAAIRRSQEKREAVITPSGLRWKRPSSIG